MIMINIALDAMGIALILTLLTGALLSGQKQNRQGRFFVALLVLTMVQQLSDMLNWLFEAKPQYATALFAVNFVIFVGGAVTALIFFFYALSLIDPERRQFKRLRKAMIILCAVWVALNIFNIFRNVFYGVDENGSYFRGPLYLVAHVYHFFAILVSVILTLRSPRLTLRQKLALLTYALLPFGALLFQLHFYGLSALTYCALTLSMQLIYITVHLLHVAALERQGQELKKTRQAYEDTLYDAETDDLTGALNRKVFARKVEQMLSSEGESGCAMWMIDLDHFKDINDRFGHPAGDCVLEEAAGKLTALLPARALVARYGGDEFCAFLPCISLEELYQTLQRALSVMSFTCEKCGEDVQIAVSIGAAYAPPGYSTTVSELVEQADRALYTSKNNGRNLYSLKELK